MTTRTLKSISLAAALIAWIGAAGAANFNRIAIDSNAGSTNTLAIAQDDGNLAKLVGDGAAGSPLIKGSRNTVGIDQQGGNNAFNGMSIRMGSTAASLSATYAGANNTHALKIGATKEPMSPHVTINLTNDSNTIANSTSGGGLKTINQTIGSDGNLVTVGLNGTGTQSSDLTIAGTSWVNFTHISAAPNSAAVVGLSNVTGALAGEPLGSTRAKVLVTQTASADAATANLNVTGTGLAMGTLGAALTVPAGYGSNPGVYVYQNSPGAVLNATVTGGMPGYTAKFIQ